MRQAWEPETMRCSSPHDLTDTPACRPIIPHPRRRHRPQPSRPTTYPGQRDAVDATIGAWLADRLRPPPRPRRVIAVDGKAAGLSP